MKAAKIMKAACLFQFLLSLVLLSVARLAAADGLIYFPATVENTTLADGTALKVVIKTPGDSPTEITRGTTEAEPNNHWHWREGVGSGAGDQRGVLAAAGQRGSDCPMLRTIVSGLKPKTDYQVFGFFWVAGFSSDDAVPSGDTQWDIRMGCGKAKMMGYGHRDNAGLPGTIGRRAGGDGAIRQIDTPLRPAQGGLLDRDGDRRLFRAPLGNARTDAKGTLVVDVDDQAGDSNEGRTWYDGIGVLPGTTAADVGSGSPGALHLAVRCGDWEMVRRELEAGADLNTVDHDGLTPLFYVSANLNVERVAAFLKAGAKPDVDGQALTPLWAAATSGDVAITKMLLDAGAKVPVEPLSESVLQGKLKDSLTYVPLRRLVASSRSHPAVAAICSGSLKILKLLLEKAPQLDLDGLYPSAVGSSVAYNLNLNGHYSSAVGDAVTYNHPEMAEFLIERGCRVGTAKNWTTSKDANPSVNTSKIIDACRPLIDAIMAEPPMRGVVAALERRGLTMVDTTPRVPSPFVRPFDALTAAAWAGDAELVARLLPAANKASLAYKADLIVLAETGGNEQVLTMVRKQFGDVKLPRWGGRSLRDEGEGLSDAARVFEPRTVPPKPRAEVKGKRVLAVISSPDAGGPAAAIAAKASTTAGWIVVEREQIDTLLRERDLPKPWEERAQNLGSLGDRLSADILLIVSQLKSDKLTLLRLEAVDVRTGLLIDRLHLDIKEFKPDEFCDNYLADVRRKLESHLAGGVLTAVTLLPITVDKDLSSASLKGLLHAGLLQEIDSTPGMIALTRQQMQPLAEEKTFQQSGGLWGAAWTVEGGLKPLAGGQVELALRVRSLGKGAGTHDVKAAGNAGDVQALVRNAWKQMVAAITGDSPASQAATVAAPAERASAEADRLLREVEWLFCYDRSHGTLPLVDAALYLGADPVKAELLRMYVRMALRHFNNPSVMFHVYPELNGFPLSPAVADLAAQCLEEHLELLRLNAEALDRVEKCLQDPATQALTKATLGAPTYAFYKYSNFWRNLEDLITYRTFLQPQRMDSGQLENLKTYDKELEQHLKRMMTHIEPPDAEGFVSMPIGGKFTPLHYRAVPTLGPVLAEWVTRQPGRLDRYDDPYKQLFETPFGAWGGPDRIGITCDFLEKAMTAEDLPYRNLRKAEIAFLRSHGEQRTQAARKLLEIKIQMSSHQGKPYQEWVPLEVLSQWVPMIDSGREWKGGFFIPPHGESFIPALLHSPELAPDLLVRHPSYRIFRKRWTEIMTDENEKKQILRVAQADIEQRMNQPTSQGLADSLDNLLSGIRLLDQLYGVALVAEWEPKIAKMHPKGKPKSFGSKGQFPIFDDEGTVDAKLLADVRNGATDKPAMITHSLIDPTNRHILWLVLQPYQDWDFKLQEPRIPEMSHGEPVGVYTTPKFIVRQPWLVAIDCRDGRALHKINLATIPGLWPQAPPETMKVMEFGRPNFGLFANDTHILVQIFWKNTDDLRKHSLADVFALVSINRETGEIHKRPMKDYIKDSLFWEGYDLPAVVGIGKSFYVIDNQGDKLAPNLWQLTPGCQPKLLAQYGRRPEESPFDREDRKITFLRNDGGRLLVASSRENFAYYNPAVEHWEDAPNPPPTRRGMGTARVLSMHSGQNMHTISSSLMTGTHVISART
ncbi:MAG: ankyrin repeat domain-containing protein [Verrucomicrobia bacterium]|nr:ankyrin repeat domain-containing protein [Verrucomicrobiota bacterium]